MILVNTYRFAGKTISPRVIFSCEWRDGSGKRLLGVKPSHLRVTLNVAYLHGPGTFESHSW